MTGCTSEPGGISPAKTNTFVTLGQFPPGERRSSIRDRGTNCFSVQGDGDTLWSSTSSPRNFFGVLYFSAPPVSSLRCRYKNLKKLYDLLSISFQIFQSL